jgi:ABC-2 type transport system permease protein
VNWKTFFAMLQRDGHVARRNLVPMLMQTLLQPLLLTFVFGRVLTASGMMQMEYKNVLLPGIIAIAMVLSGVQAVAMPLIAEFQFTKEIEDRLLAPMENKWLAVEKVVAGMVQSIISGLVVIPCAWLTMGSGLNVSFGHPVEFAAVVVLVAALAGTGGLLLGCSIGQTQIGLMFSMVIAPMMMFGCAYYPWEALKHFPGLQYAVLINPLVYASEGLRGALAPQVPHIPIPAVLGALAVMNLVFLFFGLKKFQSKAVS